MEVTTPEQMKIAEATTALAFRCPHCDNPQGVTDRGFLSNLAMGSAAVIDCPKCEERFKVVMKQPMLQSPGPNRQQRRAMKKTQGGLIVPGR